VGKPRHVALSVTQFNVAQKLLKHSDFVCTLPSRLIAHYENDLDGFDLSFKAQGFTMHLGWDPAYDKDPAVNWLKAKLIEAFAA